LRATVRVLDRQPAKLLAQVGLFDLTANTSAIDCSHNAPSLEIASHLLAQKAARTANPGFHSSLTRL